MKDEAIWAHYFAAAFAGRQGQLTREYLKDYAEWADEALLAFIDGDPCGECADCLHAALDAEAA